VKLSQVDIFRLNEDLVKLRAKAIAQPCQGCFDPLIVCGNHMRMAESKYYFECVLNIGLELRGELNYTANVRIHIVNMDNEAKVFELCIVGVGDIHGILARDQI